jgi:hypothetical protein
MQFHQTSSAGLLLLLLLYFSAVFTKSFAQERTIGGGEALYSNFLRFKL